MYLCKWEATHNHYNFSFATRNFDINGYESDEYVWYIEERAGCNYCLWLNDAMTPPLGEDYVYP